MEAYEREGDREREKDLAGGLMSDFSLRHLQHTAIKISPEGLCLFPCICL